ncbi:hypothetical protein MJ1_0667 [Nanobdella aerobiophila]|uniref:Uncharacterized protein n=1 Tax=Nanobdella aerobiophila TaxID=2586965 RepID=A0A915SL89_9ARCH|nr:hypothetical protein [Nanobdella aerobiophila]BBL45811.1 hypothetical protein MJ1_0667 [Nanobdella aerobiophila]
MSEELEDRWDVSVNINKDVDNLKYSKKVIIIIKNHSPFIRKFEIGTKTINLKDQYMALRFRLYYNFISPAIINIDKYRKENIELLIPNLEYREDEYILLYVKNLDKNETKEIKIYLR